MPKAKHSIQVPTADPKALLNTSLQMKNALDDLLGNKDPARASVTWQDLLNLKLINPLQVPK